MTGSDARALAQHLVQRSDDALAALLAARHVSPTASWNDAFDAAEALLEPSSIERALRGLTSGEISALADAAVDTDDAARSRLQQLALVDEQGMMYEAVSSALTALTAASTPAADVDEAEDPDAEARPDDAAAAERAFSSLGSLGDILHAALTHPFGRIGSGALGAADRRRLMEDGIVDDGATADDLVEIAERTGLLSGQDKSWLVTPAGAQWLHSDTIARWSAVATAFFEGLPRGLRRPTGGWIAPAAWVQAYPWDVLWPETAADLRGLLRRWGVLDDTGRPTSWARGAFLDGAGSPFPTAALDTLARLLPSEVDRVYLQNDLTAIAPGPLSPHLDMRLRSMARRESRAQASSYRFTAESIADALTAGESAASLRAFLSDLSLTGVPQPLAYEIERTARTHGMVRVGPDQEGRTRVSSDDEALLRTLAVDQALRPLGLIPDADALVTRSGVDTAFWMIADARYPVVAVDADGERRRLDRHRLAPSPSQPAPARDTYAALLARLRAAPAGDADAAWLGRELDHAVKARATIVVAVRMPDGTEREFTIEATGLGGGRLRGLDRAVDVERTLPVSSISGIRPL
ncbi:helicase-associated domain-containing protein [Microbacterium sp.]|uniref:helicase-associated domain-containing protein n=1 Tax=Microbacterium sp. TaxID=51671 RepID=UPI0032424901